MKKVQKVAQKLCDDWVARNPNEWLAGDLAISSLSEAYDAQSELQKLMASHRGEVAGRKIALSSKPMQELCGIDHPLAGPVFSKEIHASPATIDTSKFIHMGLEFELAMEIGEDIVCGNSYTADKARSLVSMVRPAFEMIEDRGAVYAEIDLGTITADNAWSGGIVLGEPIENWRELDFDNMKSVCIQEGREDEFGNTGAADPWASLAWVINHNSSRGETIRAGEQIITGSVIHTRFPQPGDKVVYLVGDQAKVEARFT